MTVEHLSLPYSTPSPEIPKGGSDINRSEHFPTAIELCSIGRSDTGGSPEVATDAAAMRRPQENGGKFEILCNLVSHFLTNAGDRAHAWLRPLVQGLSIFLSCARERFDDLFSDEIELDESAQKRERFDDLFSDEIELDESAQKREWFDYLFSDETELDESAQARENDAEVADFENDLDPFLLRVAAVDTGDAELDRGFAELDRGFAELDRRMALAYYQMGFTA